DEVTNVTHNIELFNLDRAFYENNLDIFSFKIDVNLRVEYGEDIKKISRFSGSTGDFLISQNKNQNFEVNPLLLCLWKNEDGELLLSINLEIIENNLEV
ncbi:MAG: hypothetical protein ACRC2K_12660, partial [Clostridium sp.]